MTTLRLGSRGSQLALYQARLVAERIKAVNDVQVDIIVIKTSGDRLQELPLSEVGGKRLFVKEIEDALLANQIDLAVHSSKDMPAVLPEGLELGAVLEREDPSDALVMPASMSGAINRADKNPVEAIRAALPPGARIGTGSVRRVAQLEAVFVGAQFENVRGNLDTRLRKLDEGRYDLLVLAAAGLRRLGFDSRISATVPIDLCVPAPGQGIIAIETRSGDTPTRQIVARVNDADAWAALEAERALVAGLGGGCQMPIGGVAVPVGKGNLELDAIVTSLDGTRAIRYKEEGSRGHAAALGASVAARLLEQGAAAILNDVRRLT